MPQPTGGSSAVTHLDLPKWESHFAQVFSQIGQAESKQQRGHPSLWMLKLSSQVLAGEWDVGTTTLVF